MKNNFSILINFCTIKGGKRIPLNSKLTEKKTAHPYIRVKNIEDKSVGLTNNFFYIDDQVFNKISRYIVNNNDVILSNVGTIGKCGIIDKTLNKANLTENCVKLTNLKNITPDFLYYNLISDFGQRQIESHIVGSIQPKLPIYNIEKIKIPVISVNEQLRITNIVRNCI